MWLRGLLGVLTRPVTHVRSVSRVGRPQMAVSEGQDMILCYHPGQSVPYHHTLSMPNTQELAEQEQRTVDMAGRPRPPRLTALARMYGRHRRNILWTNFNRRALANRHRTTYNTNRTPRDTT